MKRIEHYKRIHIGGEEALKHGDSFLFHCDVLSHKNRRSEKLVEKIVALNSKIETRYDAYDAAFHNDALETIREDRNMQSRKDELEALYEYRATIFQKLRTTLLTKGDVLDDICPCCEKDSCNSFDHLLPQSKFPEFSDHPLNLLPCCTECNGHKLANWLDASGQRRYLNLFIDELPHDQYLFCTINIVNGNNLEYSFHVKNTAGIDPVLFERIKNTFEDSWLAKRYKERCGFVISQFKTQLRPWKMMVNQGTLTKEDVRLVMLRYAEEENNEKGGNYWQSLIRISCCEKNVFDVVYDEA